MKFWFTRLGLEFERKGDTVIYLWPWHRQPDTKPFISLAFTGNGDFGDARFSSLAELDRAWDGFYQALHNDPPL